MKSVGGVTCRYSTLVFDCDGVVLDSNSLKTEAFYDVALRYGPEAAKALVNYHIEHGGVSRYKKFEYLLKSILGESGGDSDVKVLTDSYGECVYRRLLNCSVAENLIEVRAMMADQAWMLVSGGDEAELKRIFGERKLASLFDKGIHGSPANKDAIFDRELRSGKLKLPAVYIGDSRYDHEAASRAGLDFVFVHGWSEFEGWQAYCVTHQIPFVRSLSELPALLGG